MPYRFIVLHITAKSLAGPRRCRERLKILIIEDAQEIAAYVQKGLSESSFTT
jgi:hypothetical protein